MKVCRGHPLKEEQQSILLIRTSVAAGCKELLTLVPISIHSVIGTRVKVVVLRCRVFSNGVDTNTDDVSALEHELYSVP